MKIKNLFLIFLLAQFVSVSGQDFFAVGDWYKFGVTKSGVYQLRKSDLEKIGFDVSKPKNIAIYGSDGSMLNQKIDSIVPNKPSLIPHLLLDTGSFANDFALYFFSQSSNTIKFQTNRFTTNTNLYTDTVYYFLHVGEDIASQISSDNSVIGTDSAQIFTYQRIEKDETNLFHSGRIWLYNKMTNADSLVDLQIPVKGAINSINAYYNLVGSSVNKTTYFDIISNNNVIATSKISKSNNGYGIKARAVNGTVSEIKDNILGDVWNLQILYDLQGDINAYGYIDYLDVQYLTDPKSLVNNDEFYNLGRKSSFKIGKRSESMMLWNQNIFSNSQSLIMPLNQGDSLIFSLEDDTSRNVLIDINSELKHPIFLNKVKNFNLTLGTPNPQMLVLYYSTLEEGAEAFQKYKNSIGINTSIVDINEVVDLYGRGIKDISAVRNYIKYVYEQSQTLKYVLLMGNCSYDYKNRISDNSNDIPTYESLESYHNVQTYSSDDFYGFLEEGEGEWKENSLGNHSLDVAVSRIPIKTNEEALHLLDKIKEYEQSMDSKPWKSNVLFIADDGDDGLHVDQANELDLLVKTIAPFMHVEKVYLDAFKRPNNAIEISKDLFSKSLEEGAMFVNFTGHGSEYVWMEEEFLTIREMKNLQNKNKLSVFITATCEFGRYDDPAIISGAEELLIADNGAIALVTTTRPVYSSSNFAINKVFYNEVFKKDTLGKFKSLGEVFANTKNGSLNSVYNRNFSLLGDPSLKLRLPNYTVTLDSIDALSAPEFTDTLYPGENFWIKGQILDNKQQLISDYNGWIEIVIYDASEEKLTLGYGGQLKRNYLNNPNKILSLMAEVKNGSYALEISIPKEIASSFGKAQLIFSANSELHGEAFGNFNDLVIGGNAVIAENLAPEIIVDSILNSLEGTYSTEIDLKLHFADDKGILLNKNIIGKEAKVVLNDDLDNPIYFGDSLRLCAETSKLVCTELKLKNLEIGTNKIDIYVWDNEGLGSKKTVFIETGFSLNVTLYPNPMLDNLNLVVENNILGMEYSIDFNLYNTLGEQIFGKEYEGNSDGFRYSKNITAEELNIYSQGIYYYEVNVRFKDNSMNYTTKGKITKL